MLLAAMIFETGCFRVDQAGPYEPPKNLVGIWLCDCFHHCLVYCDF